MKQCALYLAILISFFSSVATAETKIYHWVDEQGKNHFSDTSAPGQDVEEISISDQNLLFNNAAQEQEQTQAKAKAKEQENELSVEPEQEKQQAIIYQASISSPQDDSTIRSNNGALDIHVATKPEKQNNQKLQLFLDGKALGPPQISSTIRALNIDRGTHQAQVHLLDENGKLLAKTQIVTVHLQRATINTAN